MIQLPRLSTFGLRRQALALGAWLPIVFLPEIAITAVNTPPLIEKPEVTALFQPDPLHLFDRFRSGTDFSTNIRGYAGNESRRISFPDHTHDIGICVTADGKAIGFLNSLIGGSMMLVSRPVETQSGKCRARRDPAGGPVGTGAGWRGR